MAKERKEPKPEEKKEEESKVQIEIEEEIIDESEEEVSTKSFLGKRTREEFEASQEEILPKEKTPKPLVEDDSAKEGFEKLTSKRQKVLDILDD